MAPEQIRGEDQDRRVDLYAFGVAAYELLTGALPHDGKTPVALLANKLQETALPPGAANADVVLPPTLEELIMRCISRAPSKRPADAEELERVLTPLLTQGGHPDVAVDLIGAMVGSHRITALLGTGGVGSVYRAEHPVIGTEVAIKVLHPETAAVPEAVDRFVEEARASSAIGSPHIPTYSDFGHLPDGRPYAVMEFFEGENLETHIRRKGPLSVEETAELVDQAAQAISQAHEAGIIHRDLKPENLFLARTKTGAVTVKVLDFGIAKVRSGSAHRTQVGFFMGTPAYCAPEQITGQGVGPETDVYALGATAFEMLTGRTPFTGSIEEVFSAKHKGEVPRIRTLRPELPIQVEQTLLGMMARDPGQRMATMEEVRVALSGWSTAPDTLPTHRIDLPVRRRKAWWLAVGAAAALAIVGAWALTRETTPTVAPESGQPAGPVATPSSAPSGTKAASKARVSAPAAQAPLPLGVDLPETDPTSHPGLDPRPSEHTDTPHAPRTDEPRPARPARAETRSPRTHVRTKRPSPAPSRRAAPQPRPPSRVARPAGQNDAIIADPFE
jgi:serine/threonine-protein kinase